MHILSVNVSKPKVVQYKGKEVSTGIYKKPVHGPVMLRKTNIDGDGQADLKVHGGLDKAVYGFPWEHYTFYQERFGPDDFAHGHFGENLTTKGMLENAVHIGDRFRIGEAVLEVSQPRSPCSKFAMKMRATEAVKTMLDSGKTGYYFRVIEEGMIDIGKTIRLSLNESAPTVYGIHQLMFFDALNVSELKRASVCSALAPSWREKFAERLRKLESRID